MKNKLFLDITENYGNTSDNKEIRSEISDFSPETGSKIQFQLNGECFIRLSRVTEHKDNDIRVMVHKFNEQKNKFYAWRKSGLPPANILLTILDDGEDKFCNRSAALVKEYTVEGIGENAYLQFWHCEAGTDVKDFLLYEYKVTEKDFQAVVDDLNENLTIGLNLRRKGEYFVCIIRNGEGKEIRHQVKAQLTVDQEIWFLETNDIHEEAEKSTARSHAAMQRVTLFWTRIFRSLTAGLSKGLLTKIAVFGSVLLLIGILSEYFLNQILLRTVTELKSKTRQELILKPTSQFMKLDEHNFDVADLSASVQLASTPLKIYYKNVNKFRNQFRRNKMNFEQKETVICSKTGDSQFVLNDDQDTSVLKFQKNRDSKELSKLTAQNENCSY